mgnify:CR=1 FL=1
MIRTEKILLFLLVVSTLIICLVVGTALFDGFFFHGKVFASSKPNQRHNPGEAPDISNDDQQESWNEFEKREYGFKLLYPDNLSPRSVYNRKGLNKGVGVSYETPMWKLGLENLNYYQGTNLLEASLVIHVARGENAVATCSQFKQGSMIKAQNEGMQNPPVVEINGIPFTKDRVIEGAMGERYEKITFNTVHENACYQLTILMRSQNIQLSEEVREFSKEKVVEELFSVISTFRFLDVEPTFPKQAPPPSGPDASSKSLDKSSEGYADGIDVSHWQGDILWAEVAGAGYSFAFAKATEGVGFIDSMFYTNIQAGTSSGVLMGAYHYGRPDLNNTGAEEAEFFLSVVGDYIEAGYLRPVLDLEVTGDLSREEISAWTVEWIETVKEETGVEPLIYTYYYFILDNFNNSVKDYDLWIAYWNCDPTPTHDIPPTNGFADWDFWQYQAPGGCGSYTIPGVEGAVDLNIFNGIKEELIAFESDAPLWVSLTSDAYRAPKPYYADLTADVNGSATGPMNIAFWWGCNELGNDISNVMAVCGELPTPEEGQCLKNEYGLKCNAVEDENQLAEHTYMEIGDYTPKVIVERAGEVPAEDRYYLEVFNPLVSMTVEPVSPGSGISTFEYDLDVGVKIITSIAGSLQVEIEDTNTGEMEDQICVSVGDDINKTVVFPLNVNSDEIGLRDYTVWARYRYDGSCPIKNASIDDNSVSYQIQWTKPILDTVGFFDPSLSRWFLKNSHTWGWDDYFSFQFGDMDNDWVPISGDWDGDGIDGVGFYNPTLRQWILKNSLEDGQEDQRLYFGVTDSNWIPLTGDWDGNGVDTVGLYNPNLSKFYLKNDFESGWSNYIKYKFGPIGSGWIPISGDWDGDGVDTVGYYDPAKSKWHFKNSHTWGWQDYFRYKFGPAGKNWIPLSGDWNGDLVNTIGLFSPEVSKFYLKNSHVGGWEDYMKYKFGPIGAGWDPLAGDWDGK